jgi:ArsR family transcriptional regulator, arsenate/arsenite/antimonite-responsive transcriptional repressor
MKTNLIIDALGSLAQETRLGIFRLLVGQGPAGLAAGAIAERLDVPTSSLSFHLAHLTRAGLLIQRRAGRSLIYSADFGGMNSLVAYLTENCCQGRPEACGLPVCDPVPARPGRAAKKAAR